MNFSAEEWYEAIEALKLLDGCIASDVNKHDRVITLIEECIRLGITEGPAIIAALKLVGYNPRHVGKLLHDDAGSNPERHRWQRSPDGDYSLID